MKQEKYFLKVSDSQSTFDTKLIQEMAYHYYIHNMKKNPAFSVKTHEKNNLVNTNFYSSHRLKLENMINDVYITIAVEINFYLIPANSLSSIFLVSHR